MAVHVVRSGESLWGISRMYGVSISTIITANGLPSANLLVPGLALYIPLNQAAKRYYRIKAGDNLWMIALKFKTTVETIVQANSGIDPKRMRTGQIITIPTNTKLEIATLGFVVPYSPKDILENITNLANQLTYLAVASYSFTNEGYAFVQLDDQMVVAGSRQLNVTPLLMIRNLLDSEFSADLAGNVLVNPVFRRNLVLSLINLVHDRGYGGVSVDFEFIPPARRNDFILFLAELKKALGNLLLHVNVHAKTADIPNNPIIGAYDYRGIANIADIVAVMTIDYGYPGGPPDAIAPTWWVDQVIAYAITQIHPKKLQIAMALYGYDKIVPTNKTTAMSALGAQNLAIRSGTVIDYDTLAESPTYRYWSSSEEHIVWFEDIRSFMAKYELIDIHGLLGTTYWQLSLAAPQNWAFLQQNIMVKK